MKDSNRNLQVDGLRGLTVLFIATYHLFCRYQQLFCNNDVIILHYLGSFGVTIFLMISAWYADSGRINRVPKKILRLYPSYVLCISIIAILLYFLPLAGRTITVKDFILNLFWINGYIGTPYVDGAHWYLPILISVIIVFAAFHTFKVDHSVLSYIGWLCLILIVKKMNLNIVSRFLAGSYAGIACASISLKRFLETTHRKEQLKWVGLGIISCLFLLITLGLPQLIELIITIPLIYCVMNRRLSVLEIPVLRFFGEISYPLYLIHQNVSYIVITQITLALGRYVFGIEFIAFGLVLVLSIIIYRLVEHPWLTFLQNKDIRKSK